MSSRNTGLEQDERNYFSPHVGGKTLRDTNSEYNKQQIEILKRMKKKVPEKYEPSYGDMYSTSSGLLAGQLSSRHPPKDTNTEISKNRDNNDKYDFFGDYLYKSGLKDRDNTTRYITEYINIDSSTRNINPANKIDKLFEMQNNLTLTRNSNILSIYYPNHQFAQNDKIVLTGIINISKTIKIIVNNIKKIDFESGSQYMTIYDDIGFTFQSTSDANNYNTSDMYVIIDGVKGFPGSTYIENIPLNTINGTQRVYLVHPEKQTYFGDRYYIKLVNIFNGTYEPSTYNIQLTYLFTGGIPNNIINADYPTDSTQLFGNQIISSTSKDYINITLKKESAGTITNFGGFNIYVGKINNILEGYINQNSYTIILERVFQNIVSARLVSTEFPNTEKVIRSTPTNKKNNKLYWQNLDEGNYVYSIEIPSGNYKASNLATIIQNNVLAVPKLNASELGGIISNTNYTNNNYMRVNIDTDTDIVTFSSYKEALLVKPFISVYPEIDLKATETTTLTSYDITIQQLNHGISVGDIILISGAIAYYGIPESVLNNQFSVTEIVDKDRYKISVSHFNLSTQRSDTGGGSAITIIVPNMFRLRFDYPDTFGSILGFRNVGQTTSITNYNTSITNVMPYKFEQTVDTSGSAIIIKNNSLNLSGDNYILMVCNQLKGIYNSGSIKEAFGKIQLSGIPGKVLFNTFTPSTMYYHDPIVEITQLEFQFYSPDGTLYDFNGIDHSFTLELVTESEIPKGTGITTNIGKIN
jgi:hypothetical protein